MRLFDTLSRRKKTVKPDGTAKIYTCGPTVYDYAHVGNLRTYVAEDIMKRAIARHFPVKHVMNITDVGHLTSDADTGEDKMEIGARREKKDAWQIADFYTKQFLNDMEKLGIKKPDVLCRATDNIREMIELVAALEKKGYTYRTEDGIYFDTSKFKSYGKLSRLKKEKIKAGARVEMGTKRRATDFALWKFSRESRQMEWGSPWGRGFPGWHIECSAMAMKYLGTTLDVHAGGEDHVAVHHTNEIAQSEAATGKKFAKIWMHVSFMLLNGKKISKSLGNYYTLEDVEQKGFSPMALRYLCASSHYRSQMNFTFDALANAENTIDSLNDFYARLEEVKENGGAFTKKAKKYLNAFMAHVDDDLDTPQALAQLFALTGEANKAQLGKEDAAEIRKALEEMDSIIGFLAVREALTKEESAMIKKREELRKAKKYAESDALRQELAKRGIIIEDTANGVRWSKRAPGKA